jgi:ferritin
MRISVGTISSCRNYITERGGRVELKAIDQPPVEFDSPTALINGLYELALEEKDYPSQVLLHWYIDEQVEEEANATAILETLKMAGEKGQALVMMDRALAHRDE